MSDIVNGCTYAYKSSGKTLHVKVLRFDPIARRHIVTSNNGRTEWSILSSSLGRRVRPTKRKMDTDKVYLYMCSIGKDTYKLGVTCDPERRRKQIKTYTPTAQMKSVVRMAAHKRGDWAQVEKAVLRRFAAHRAATGGKEVFCLDRSQASACAGFMKSVCA